MRVMKRNQNKAEETKESKGKPLMEVFKELETKEKTVIVPDNTINRAIELVIEAHKGQVREYSGIPYVFHLFDVAKRASSYFEPMSVSDTDFMVACLLHDTIEDTKVTYEYIVDHYGKNVADIVREVSRPKNMGNNFESKYKYLLTFYDKSKEAIVLKIADRICNTMDYLQNPETAWYALRYALQAYHVYNAYIHKDGIHPNPKIIAEVAWVENLVRMRYNISVYTSSEEEIEKALGIGVKENKNKE